MIIDSTVIRGEMMRQEIGVNALGKKAGIEPRAVSKYARFDCDVHYPTVGKIAKALNIEPERLLKKRVDFE